MTETLKLLIELEEIKSKINYRLEYMQLLQFPGIDPQIYIDTQEQIHTLTSRKLEIIEQLLERYV